MNITEQHDKTAFVCGGLMVAMLASVFAGCATTPRQCYSGAPLPDSQVARISMEAKDQAFGDNSPKVRITHVDRQTPGWGESFETVDVLPGVHSITVFYKEFNPTAGVVLQEVVQEAAEGKSSYLSSGYGQILNLKAQAGHKYILKHIDRRLPLLCWIEDEITKQVVSDAKPPLVGTFGGSPVLSGWATTEQAVPVPNQIQAVNPAKCRIYVFRAEAMQGGTAPMKVMDKDQMIGTLGMRSFLCWERDPGKTTVSLDLYMPGSYIVNMREALDTQGGAVYYLRASVPTASSFSSDADLVDRLWRLSDEEGKKLLGTCKAPPSATQTP